ncbi:hypothetical protein M8J77_003538 [Diaphorina citri]|nr:hypothetical protein M8J77_003538 [Diaphorina citri]
MMDMKNKYLREGEPQQAAEEPEVNVREGEIEPEVNVRDDAVEEEVNVREGAIEPEVNVRDDAVEEEEVNVRESAVEPEINVREGVEEEEEEEEEEVNVREDAAAEEEEEVNMNRKKRGRKRKHQGQTNKSAKKLKNANENYFNYKGKLVNSKNFNYNIKCPCKLQCYKEIPRDLQENEFNNFWNLGDYTHQNMFLTKNVEEKESTVDENGNNKKGKKLFTRSYKIGNTPVCREMFRNVYQISTKRINTALTKLRNGNLQDLRGTLQGGQNKTSPDSVEKVKDHIKKLSQYKPHYKRGQKESKFLSPGMTLEKIAVVPNLRAITPQGVKTLPLPRIPTNKVSWEVCKRQEFEVPPGLENCLSKGQTYSEQNLKKTI